VFGKHTNNYYNILRGDIPTNNIQVKKNMIRYIPKPIKEYTKQSDTINTNINPAKNIYDENHKNDGSIGDKTT
jgi:hypothetical protein